ncbi:hypothetical protein NQ315_009894 [Exocentrus adspersus]|uniref:RRP15-like protein n=1 Tax=Exocentrus adspersus TaxID=1586481 RepID=A0AAV8WHM0_9CUCU|nr:hypothetical protein NQ315_009894 [Exocentrus adspersus]
MVQKEQINSDSDSDGPEDASAEDNVPEEHENDGDNNPENTGWADSVAKILKTNKPKGKKAIVLSKAKKLTDVRKEKMVPAGFEVQTADGEIKEEKVEVKIEADVDLEEPRHKKRRILRDIRIKPNILEKDRERTLQKIATKGVVQLFNAVKSQQKQIGEKLKEAGPLEVRKEKVLKNIDKRAFLDVLMGEKSQKVDDSVSSINIEGRVAEDAGWSVFKDDFMMSAKMKDWDKVMDESDEAQNVEID